MACTRTGDEARRGRGRGGGTGLVLWVSPVGIHGVSPWSVAPRLGKESSGCRTVLVECGTGKSRSARLAPRSHAFLTPTTGFPPWSASFVRAPPLAYPATGPTSSVSLLARASSTASASASAGTTLGLLGGPLHGVDRAGSGARISRSSDRSSNERVHTRGAPASIPSSFHGTHCALRLTVCSHKWVYAPRSVSLRGLSPTSICPFHSLRLYNPEKP